MHSAIARYAGDQAEQRKTRLRRTLACDAGGDVFFRGPEGSKTYKQSRTGALAWHVRRNRVSFANELRRIADAMTARLTPRNEGFYFD